MLTSLSNSSPNHQNFKSLPPLKPKKDTLFATSKAPADFVFDKDVADVFEDMISRSVPGYSIIISMIGLLGRQYCAPGSVVYDLGCSLGAASFAIQEQVPHRDYRIIAIDNSAAMIEKMQEKINEDPDTNSVIDLKCCDITDVVIQNASVVVLNFTLQFIPREQRSRLIAQIYEGLQSGGLLILSEKIKFPDPELDSLLVDSYHTFKEKMGYSKLEISRKRSALENVLIPESIASHKSRVSAAGFKAVDVWFQCFNFASLVAFK